MLEQTSPSYGGLIIRAFCDKNEVFFAQFQRAPFGKSSQKMSLKRLSLRDFASSGHVSTLAIAKVRQKCFLLSNFDIPAYYLAGFSKRLSTVTSPVSRVPPPPPLSLETFQSQALIKMATVSISELVWTF